MEVKRSSIEIDGGGAAAADLGFSFDLGGMLVLNVLCLFTALLFFFSGSYGVFILLHVLSN